MGPVCYPTMPEAQLIDGTAIARRVRTSVAQRAARLRERGEPARLDAVLVAGEQDAAARVYAQKQAETCATLGIEYHLHTLDADARYDDVAGRVLLLSSDPNVRAIMVHMPLPEGVDAIRVQSLIHPSKDVEGVNPANIGNVVYGRSSLAPCTALAVVRMVRETGVELRGKLCVVVGASDIVGKPIAVILMRPEATVVSCNKHTPDITSLTTRADVLVGAAGVPGLITPEWVRPGATVIDVGIHRVEGDDGVTRTIGDVDPSVRGVAGAMSPVPGGVGPVTVAMLLENVVAACEGADRGA
ncbi:MAG: bifunctional methylenetetrahydrofolate dehydrogenase/methenyltetrahydrofolate cyclohydrolase FolD [Phycisphaerales bacterium]